MEDKTFELLERMYSDITKRLDGLESSQKEFKSGQDELRSGQDELRSGQQQLEKRLTQIETTLEHSIKEKLQALHERESINTDTLAEHGKQLENINDKLDQLFMSSTDQDKRLKVVEASKKKA